MATKEITVELRVAGLDQAKTDLQAVADQVEAGSLTDEEAVNRANEILGSLRVEARVGCLWADAGPLSVGRLELHE